MSTIYLDYNATTPIAPEVADAMKPYLDKYFGNPSSFHEFGIASKKAIETARKQLAELINCFPDEIIFTSGGTESNNLSVQGIALFNQNKGKHIITSSIEHPAISEVCRHLTNIGFHISYLPVDEFGVIDPEVLISAITKDTILITIMHSNNEIGTIQNIKKLAEIAHKNDIIFHTDAAQSVGKTKIDVKELDIDLMSIAGHKFYAPKGIGALYMRRGVKIQKLLFGADHESNIRPGTENVLEIVGLGAASAIAKRDLDKNVIHFKEMRNLLETTLKEELPQIRVNGHPEQRLTNTLSVSFPGIDANTLLSRMKGIAASAGAACHTDSKDTSSVLISINTPSQYAPGTLRFSVGRETTLEEITKASEQIIYHAKKLMKSDEKDSIHIDLTTDVRLTQFTHGLGCACKFDPQKLEKIVLKLPKMFDSNVLVGTETHDDAAVYKINEEQALVQTVDFFTPIVDDPYDFGAIAAANALSDIYAMGAKPLFGLNIVSFPHDVLPMEVLEDILRGASEKAMEAGISILGGHTIEDNEPKFGMVISGIINPKKILKNTGARIDDVIILTKKIGTGVATTALKRGELDNALLKEVTQSMKTLNNKAAEVMVNYDVSCCTDVTGFGLIGHLSEISNSSNHDVELFFDQIPFFNDIFDLGSRGMISGGTKKNYNHFGKNVDFGSLSTLESMILCDAQTSGGLLIVVAQNQSTHLLNALKDKGIDQVCIIGKFLNKGKGKIFIR